MAETKPVIAASSFAILPATYQSYPLLLVSAGLIVYINFTKRGNFQWKALGSILFALMAGLVGIVSGIVLTPLGRRGYINLVVARFFKYAGCYFTGIHFKVIEGQKYLNENPVVFVANHQSSMDVLMLGAVFPKDCAVVAKSEMKWYPFLGQFMMMSQAIFLDRKNRDSSINAFKSAAIKLKRKKVSAWIFPEGTRSHSTETMLLPFKKGAFHLAVQAGVPIVPVVVANYSHLYDSKHKVFRSGIVPIKVLPPIPTADLTDGHEDIDNLLNKTRDVMLQALKEITPEEKESKKDQ